MSKKALQEIETARDKYLQNLVLLKGRRNAKTEEEILHITSKILNKYDKTIKMKKIVKTVPVQGTLEEWSLDEVEMMKVALNRGRRTGIAAPTVVDKLSLEIHGSCGY